MMRIWVLLLLGFTTLEAQAQFAIGVRPAGVVTPIPRPATGVGVTLPHTNVIPHRMAYNLNPFGFYGGGLPFYPSFYPDWNDPGQQQPIINNIIQVPAPAPALVSAPEPVAVTPPETKAYLTLHIPQGGKVWSHGQEVDTKAVPIILESPDLKPNQSYTFDVKVSWKEGDRKEERARTLAVPVGENKSLTYSAVK
jgi:hypothetical protein